MSKIWDALKKAELEREPIGTESEGAAVPRLLSGRQRTALAAILQSASLEEATAACGVSRRTLERWLRSPSFAAAYQAASRAAFAETIVQLRAASIEATEVLRGALRDAEPALRLRAAEAIVDAASRLELASALASASRRERSRK